MELKLLNFEGGIESEERPWRDEVNAALRNLSDAWSDVDSKTPSAAAEAAVKLDMRSFVIDAPTCNALKTLDNTMIKKNPHGYYWRAVRNSYSFEKRYDEMGCDFLPPADTKVMGFMCDCVRSDGHRVMGKNCTTPRSPRSLATVNGICASVESSRVGSATYIQGTECGLDLKGRTSRYLLDIGRARAMANEECPRD